jgi:hypothetical protein
MGVGGGEWGQRGVGWRCWGRRCHAMVPTTAPSSNPRVQQADVAVVNNSKATAGVVAPAHAPACTSPPPAPRPPARCGARLPRLQVNRNGFRSNSGQTKPKPVHWAQTCLPRLQVIVDVGVHWAGGGGQGMEAVCQGSPGCARPSPRGRCMPCMPAAPMPLSASAACLGRVLTGCSGPRPPGRSSAWATGHPLLSQSPSSWRPGSAPPRRPGRAVQGPTALWLRAHLAPQAGRVRGGIVRGAVALPDS